MPRSLGPAATALWTGGPRTELADRHSETSPRKSPVPFSHNSCMKGRIRCCSRSASEGYVARPQTHLGVFVFVPTGSTMLTPKRPPEMLRSLKPAGDDGGRIVSTAVGHRSLMRLVSRISPAFPVRFRP